MLVASGEIKIVGVPVVDHVSPATVVNLCAISYLLLSYRGSAAGPDGDT